MQNAKEHAQREIATVFRSTGEPTAILNNLRRCSRCALPETHETIVFDRKGVCNVCRPPSTSSPASTGPHADSCSTGWSKAPRQARL